MQRLQRGKRRFEILSMKRAGAKVILTSGLVVGFSYDQFFFKRPLIFIWGFENQISDKDILEGFLLDLGYS